MLKVFTLSSEIKLNLFRISLKFVGNCFLQSYTERTHNHFCTEPRVYPDFLTSADSHTVHILHILFVMISFLLGF